MSRFQRTIESAKEYRHVKKHAAEIGFTPGRHVFRGSWEDDRGRDILFNVSGKEVEPRSVGHKYFEIPIKTEDRQGNPETRVMPIVPVEGSAVDDGHVQVTYYD